MKNPPTPLVTGSVPVSSTGCFVYRAFDEDDDLLYVGIADDMLGRQREHKLRSPWVALAVRVEWALYASRQDAELVEKHAIIDEQPNYNIAQNQRRARAAEMGHRRLHHADAWHRLGQEARARREAQRLTQTWVAQQSGASLEWVRGLEHGTVTSGTHKVLAGVEAALWWRAGSVEMTLEGGRPEEMTTAERMAQALEAARAMLEARRS